MVIDAVMHDAKVDAVEIDDLVFLVIHFGRSVEEFGACGAQVRAPAGSRVIPVARGRWPRMEILRLCERMGGEDRKNQRQTKSRSKFLNHVLLLFWRAPSRARTLTPDAAQR